MNNRDFLILLAAVIVSILLIRYVQKEKFHNDVTEMAADMTNKNKLITLPCKKLGDPGHCPQTCSQFLYPDMYSPLGQKCSNPFSWGFLYSTGRCPHAYLDK